MKILRNQQICVAGFEQALRHTLGGVLLALHLRVAVDALQEGRIAVTSEVGDCVLAHALVQKRRDEKVAQRMQMVAFRKAQLREQRLQVLAEHVRVDDGQ